MTYDMKSEDMDKRALIQQYLNGRLDSAQIADFTRQLKDPEFCRILSEEREIAEKRKAASQATATMAKVADAKPLSEQEQETLIDLYLRGEMIPETESQFLDHIKTDKELQRQVQLVANIVKGVLAEQRQSDLEFGCAMKNLTRDRLEQIIGPRRSAAPRHASSNTRVFDRPDSHRQRIQAYRSAVSDRNDVMCYCHKVSTDIFDNLESSNSVASDIYERFKPDYAAYGIDIDALSEADKASHKCLNVIKTAYGKVMKSLDNHKILTVSKDLAVEYLHVGMIDKFKEILDGLRVVAARSSSKEDDALKRDIRLLLALSETI